jgi:hypothetical protein
VWPGGVTRGGCGRTPREERHPHSDVIPSGARDLLKAE